QAEEVVRCPALAGSDLVHWIQERAVSGGSRLEGAVASRLAAIVGPDLWLMHSELEKLIVYADGRPITIRMVDDMAASAPAPTIFMLVDAIVERNMRLAHTRLDDLYMKGLPAGYVFTMVARQLRLIAQVHEGRGWSGTPPSGELAGLAPFALQRVSRQAQRLPEAATRRALEHVRDADRAIKTGQMSDRVALDMLISDIVGASGA
ncbi:MAG: DNA polymerase III subunit delta, partial [Dehalococcoidia bacterium]|nr:DNA polymerase III subunit delta [Dehalococcoidia bacterium]